MALAMAGFGTYVLSKKVLRFCNGILKYCLLPKARLESRYGGGFALVTGASDGIGKSYARVLAREGFNIVLMARDKAKLDVVAKEIRDEFKVQTVVIVYDFAKLATRESITELEALLNRYLPADLSILVNNVGCSKTGMLDKHTVWDAMRQINVNLNSQVYMTRLLLPRLLERPYRSAIINLSSVAYEHLSGFVPIYSATKSFNLALSNSLHDAYYEKIDVLAVTPGGVKS